MQDIRYSRHFGMLMQLIDAGILLGGSWLLLDGLNVSLVQEWRICILIIIVWFLTSSRFRLYEMPRALPYTLYMQNIGHQFLLYAMLVGLMFFSFYRNVDINVLVKFGVLVFGIFFLQRTLIFALLKYIRRKGYNHQNVMFLFGGCQMIFLEELVTSLRKDYGFLVVEYNGEYEKNKDLEKLMEFWRKNGIARVFMPLEPPVTKLELEKLLQISEEFGVEVNFVPGKQNLFLNHSLDYINIQPLMVPVRFPLDYIANRMLKRLADILISAMLLLVVGSWLIPLISFMIRRQDGGDAFFIQPRYGKRGKLFSCLKFRTMIPNAQLHTTVPEDERITPLGKLLRSSSLDEFPQLINVLRGEMSLVGPRPHMKKVDDHHCQKISQYYLRSRVLPGITGLAQISGYRGDGENVNQQMQRRMMSDAYYVRHWSLAMDFIILLKTFWLLIVGDKNAY